MSEYIKEILGYDECGMSLAEELVVGIMDDLHGRSGGLEFDEDIISDEIGPAWRAIIEEILSLDEDQP